MLKIWGRRDSFNLQKVMWCVAELGIAHQRIDAGGTHGVTDTADYLAMNPNGRVPTIDDDGFVLWESNAIVRYLSAKHGLGTLCPDDPQRRADADRWMEWQSATVGAVMRPLIITMFRTKPEDRDPAAVARQVAEAGRYWAMFDARRQLITRHRPNRECHHRRHSRWFGLQVHAVRKGDLLRQVHCR